MNAISLVLLSLGIASFTTSSVVVAVIARLEWRRTQRLMRESPFVHPSMR